jgi:oligopeptide/dipeptide ABC transporter ATP-binding protein
MMQQASALRTSDTGREARVVPLPTAPEARPLLRVENLVKHHSTRRGILRAVDGVSFELAAGATLGLVGESGCGKSTLGRAILGLDRVDGGSVRFEDRELVGLSRRRMRPLRRHMQMVFQDPFGSLNPRSTVGRILSEPFRVHGIGTRAERKGRVMALLERVGLRPEHAERYPHEFSGGQRQRISIARAIALKPKLIICDEAVSALDVSIQAQIVNLLKSLQAEFGLSYLFISHDLGVVAHMADVIAVMYLGRIVEIGTKERLIAAPRHPYTQALFSAVPRSPAQAAMGARSGRIALRGEPPSPLDPPSGCGFHPRCAFASERCRGEAPALREIAAGQDVACHHPIEYQN